ncbi:c-type cytochrome [Hansschlegelia sp. KR7-227]|uniref:c-type cytochrome n=1 Tax=Hansschlegelia sp. KR7-227 TaxID=3400914 RepID=UPI003C062221
MSVRGLLTGLCLGSALIAVPATAADGPFTQAQADGGKVVFNNHCAQCHRPNLKGGLGPALIGDPFKAKWGGQPVANLRDWIHANMPQNAPGSLPDDQLNPIVAYILSKNGVTAGQAELTKDTASGEFPK